MTPRNCTLHLSIRYPFSNSSGRNVCVSCLIFPAKALHVISLEQLGVRATRELVTMSRSELGWFHLLELQIVLVSSSFTLKVFSVWYLEGWVRVGLRFCLAVQGGKSSFYQCCCIELQIISVVRGTSTSWVFHVLGNKSTCLMSATVA